MQTMPTLIQCDRFGCEGTTKRLVCVYLLSVQNTGQKATAVAESPTSNMEEHGLISGGREASEASNPHGPHTITWANTQTQMGTISFLQ